MRRLLTFLILFAMVSVHGPVLATAMCQHRDAIAHAVALESSEAAVAGTALEEERATKGANANAMLSHAAATLLGGYILPPETAALSRHSLLRTTLRVTHDPEPDGRSVPPLLEPPSA